jgi:hypothetical protein
LLEDENIFIKDASSKFADGHVYWRLAVRTPRENQQLCNQLAIGRADESISGSIKAGANFEADRFAPVPQSQLRLAACNDVSDCHDRVL